MTRQDAKHKAHLHLGTNSYNYWDLDVVMSNVEWQLQDEGINSDDGMFHLSLDPTPDGQEYILTCWWTEGKE